MNSKVGISLALIEIARQAAEAGKKIIFICKEVKNE